MAGVVVARQQPPGFAQPDGNHIEGGALDALGHLLLEARHGDAGLADDFAGIGKERSVEQLHDGALPGTIAAEKADPLATLDGKVGAIEQRGAAESDRNVLHAQQRHREPVTKGRISA